MIIDPALAPAIGPYSHAARMGNLLFVSGQVPLNSAGDIVGATMAEQTGQALRNLGSILAHCGLGLENVGKVVVYVADISAFAEMNAVYAKHFADHKPARSCVEVSRLVKGMLVEIEVIAEYP